MSMDLTSCWICNRAGSQVYGAASQTARYECPTCGTYDITLSCRLSRNPLEESERYRLSYWTVRRQLEGREPPLFDTYTMGSVVADLPNPPPHEKPDLLLSSLALKFPFPAKPFPLLKDTDYSLACARNGPEFRFFLDALFNGGLVEPGMDSNTITLLGWARVAALAEQPLDSRTAFVAMKFNDEMLTQVWPNAIKPAIEKAGFDAHLANDPVHNEHIDMRIITEIKQCRFVVADVSYASPGVYFEAGYAFGLSRPVIWSCRADREKSDLHFDARQYPCILWSGMEQLAEQLYYRIAATI